MKRRKLITMGLLAACVVSVALSASASATEFFNAGGTLITSALKILGTQTTNQVFKGTLAGVKITITCPEAYDTGSINNASGMGLGLLLMLYSNCTVSGAGTGGCQVANGQMIHLHMHVLAVGTSLAPELEFAPESGETIVEITFTGCTEQPALNISFPLNGRANAIVNNASEEIEFNAASTGNLTFGGNRASLTGKSKIEMEGGGRIAVE